MLTEALLAVTSSLSSPSSTTIQAFATMMNITYTSSVHVAMQRLHCCRYCTGMQSIAARHSAHLAMNIRQAD